MAYVSRKDLFGRWLGLTRGPSPKAYAPNGFVGASLSLGSEGSEAVVDIKTLTTLETLSTATAAIAVRGVSLVSSGASTTYTMAAGDPASGQGYRRLLTAVSSSTSVRQITSALPIVCGGSVGGNSGTIAATTSFTVMTFNGVGQSIELLAVSTAYWQCISLNGFSTAATPLTTV